MNSPANDVETNPGPNLDLATCMFTPCDEGSQKFMCSITNLPLAVKHCLKPSKPLGKPSKVIYILGDGNYLLRALSYAVSGRQVYHTQNPKLHANNKNCSHTKNKSKIQKQKIVSSKLKKMQDNQNKSCKTVKFPKTSTMIDKLAFKK